MYGTLCFREGKVEWLTTWLNETADNLTDSYFYSDSHNDLPLLEAVKKPIAVNPDETLRSHAEMKDWDIINLKS